MSLTRRDDGERSRLVDPFERTFLDWPFPNPFGLRRFFDLEDDSIKVEEFMDGDELVVRAELPGVDPERDVDVSIRDGALVIRAERRRQQATNERQLRRSELRYGSFSRTIPMPPGTKDSDVKASYKDGLLEVRCPVDARSTNASRIPIERGR